MDFALKRCAFASGALAYGPRSALRVEQALLAANVRALRAGRPTLTPRLGPRSPGGPSLRSGKLLPAARGQVRPAPWRGLPLKPACPSASGPGLYAPGLRHRGWGRFRLGPHALPAPPATTVSGGPLTAASAGRLRSPSGGSAPGGAAWSVVRFSDFGTFARLRPPPTGRLQTRSMPWTRASPRRAMGSSPRPRGVAPWNLPARRAYFEIFASEPTCKTLRQALPIYFGVPVSLHR